MSATDFQIDWLNDRFAFDNEARNQDIEKLMLSNFSPIEQITIVDIGSGTAANCLYFVEKLFRPQHWILVEQDQALCNAARIRIERFLNDYNFFYSYQDGVFRIKVWEHRVKIEIINASFYDLEELTDLTKVDLLMAAAVFDVLTVKQLDSVLAPVFKNRIPMFTTMNYQSMRFSTESEADHFFVNAYESHMQRKQEQGRALGNLCQEVLLDVFKKNNYQIEPGKSTWHLETKAQKMHQHLLSFMETALTGFVKTNKFDFIAWLHEKRQQSELGELRIWVEHFDAFAKAD